MDIVEKFRENANALQAEKKKAYLRNQFEFIGLSTPVRRNLQKDFLKEKVKEKLVDWDFIWEMWDLPEREFQYFAMDYLIKLKKSLTLADFPQIKKLAISKSWWESVDTLDELIGAVLLSVKNSEDLTELSKVKEVILLWSEDENFWVRRLAIDCQLGFKEKTDLELFDRVVKNNLAGSSFDSEFFINKSIGWALRDLSKSNPDWVRHFLEENRGKMAQLSLREASKYL
ncbi:DNA alkylation repair protein [Lactococcus nasutitermitis]|uniref:DNA alkylation repair protein n=1 Tax=Lactococcus nasutitermitis TaxID=1652957 RepID=A0ABV9JEF9_9LACT|nr:DNA alkylation repair protein [Lactococcus nasutitermitis]